MKSLRFNRLMTAVILCVVILLCLQWYWLVNLLRWQKTEFNRSINLALEQTLREERKQRTDSISRAVYRWLMDSSITSITSTNNPAYNQTVYKIEDKISSVKQHSDFSLGYENRPISETDPAVKETVVNHIVNKFRESYGEYQSVFYYTQAVGDSATLLSDSLRLDTARLKKFYTAKLKYFDVNTPYSLQFSRMNDSLASINQKKISADPGFRQSKTYKSDLYTNGEALYVNAYFDNPFRWFSLRLFIPLGLSLLVLAGITAILIYFYKIIRKQKLLAEIKNDFIDNMTHELKTPIAVISAAAEAMQEFGVLDDASKTGKYLRNIRTHSEQLHTTVNKVLDISSFEKEEITLLKKQVSITDIVNEIKADHQLIRVTDKIYIEILSKDDHVWADRFHFRNILYNLIDNGIKYKGPAPVEINISLRETNHSKIILVTDNGKGIEARYTEHLFEKFFRIPQGNVQQVKGSGLGLFYTKKIVQLHGGSIQVESVPGAGTTFTITLPDQN